MCFKWAALLPAWSFNTVLSLLACTAIFSTSYVIRSLIAPVMLCAAWGEAMGASSNQIIVPAAGLGTAVTSLLKVPSCFMRFAIMCAFHCESCVATIAAQLGAPQT